MNIELTDKGDPTRATATRECNDRFRSSLTGGVVVLTAGVLALGADCQARILAAVRAFDDFDDDPFDAHHLGDFEIDTGEPGTAGKTQLVFFRIDHLDPSAGRITTEPVLTIMLAREW